MTSKTYRTVAVVMLGLIGLFGWAMFLIERQRYYNSAVRWSSAVASAAAAGSARPAWASRTWTFEYGSTLGSDDTPDCRPIPPDMPPPASSRACMFQQTYTTDSYACGLWQVAIRNVHPNAGLATAEAETYFTGSAGDRCHLSYLGDARAAP